MSDMTVANTILEQLGGHRFAVMTGAKSFVGSDNSLSFRIGRNCHAINAVKITLTPKDTYDMVFYRIRGTQANIAASDLDIYCDQLQDIFTAETGMRTSLF